MRLVKRVLIVLVLIILVAAVVIFGFYGQEVRRLHAVITMFDKEYISQNFKGMTEIFPTHEVKKPATSTIFPTANQSIELPAQFEYQDSIINTSEFLDFTLTDGLIVLHQDSIIYESYGNDFKPDDIHISWSMAKSCISALFGIAIEQGHIESIEQTVSDYLPELDGSGYENVRIKDVLQMSSGVGFDEDYSAFDSDINRMGRYIALGTSMDEFASTLKREREPGTYNHYVSVDTHVIGMILKKATGQSIAEYMEQELWSKIGAESNAYWIIDDAGMEFALGGLNATLRDYLKLGKLFLDSGRWEGKQIVPEAWVVASVTPDAPHLMPGSPNSSNPDGYGFQWWIPAGAEDEFLAQGIYNQFIYVDPDKDLVICKLSSNYHFKNETVKSHKVSVELFREMVKSIAEQRGG